MKRLYIGINIFLVLLISISIFVQPKKNSIKAKSLSKSIDTKIFIAVEKKKEAKAQIKKQEVQKRVEEEKKKELQEKALKVEEEISANVAPASVSSNALEKQVGPMSAYGPDCVGCSGYLANGFDARGTTTYNDKTYGRVRIVAGDRKYPFGTIVRISGTNLGTFNAIVMDRGGAIGIGKRFMFDLLCSSEKEASRVGSFYNVNFEILRYGY